MRKKEPGQGGAQLASQIAGPSETEGVIGRQAAYDMALLTAVEQGDPLRALMLIEQGADPNARDERNHPALTVAAKGLKFHGGGRLETLKALIKAGADVNALNVQGETALSYAAAAPSIEAVEALLAAGAEPFKPCSRSWGPIHRAAERGASAILEALIKAGSPADEPNEMGETPLMIAAFYDEEPAVRALLAAGADPDRTEGGGLRALDLCRDRNGLGPRCEGTLIAAMEASALRREVGSKASARGEKKSKAKAKKNPGENGAGGLRL